MINGKIIKKLREDQKISQQELGDIIGVSKVSVSGYENGNRTPSIDTLVEISNFFGVSVDYLLGREKKVFNEDDKKFIGYISEQDIEFINELKHYPNLYNTIMKDIKKKIIQMNKKIK